MSTRKWKRLGSYLLPKELHYNDLMTDLGLYLLIMFVFLPSSPSSPLFIYGSIWEQREKKRRKSEVPPVDTIHFANQASQYSPTIQFRRKLTERNHSILMGVPIIFTKIGDYRPIWELKCSNRGCRNLGEFLLDEPLMMSVIFCSRKNVFLARTWHASAFPGIYVFLLSQPSHTSAEKRHFFDRKKEKVTFTATHYLQTAATFKNVGRSS